MLPSYLQTTVEAAHGESRLLAETEALDVDIQRVVGQRPQINMCADILQSQVGGIEESFSLGLVVLVEGHIGMAYDQRVDAQVKGLLRGGVVGCQRVDHKLAVQWGFGILTVQTEAGSKELCR